VWERAILKKLGEKSTRRTGDVLFKDGKRGGGESLPRGGG